MHHFHVYENIPGCLPEREAECVKSIPDALKALEEKITHHLLSQPDDPDCDSLEILTASLAEQSGLPWEAAASVLLEPMAGVLTVPIPNTCYQWGVERVSGLHPCPAAS